MTHFKELVSKLNEFMSLEGEKSKEQIAAYIVGELIGDYDDIYTDIKESNPSVARIAELSSDLEWSNGSRKELEEMWLELKSLISALGDSTSQ